MIATFQKIEQKHNYCMASSHGSERVITLLDYSQSHTNCIVTARVCASTICAHKSITLATVFRFSNFPPRHSWECHCKLTVWLGILAIGTVQRKTLRKCSLSFHICPPQGENISISAWGEDMSLWLADAAGPRWSVRIGIAMRHRDMVHSHFPKGQPLSPCEMSSKWKQIGRAEYSSHKLHSTA